LAGTALGAGAALETGFALDLLLFINFFSFIYPTRFKFFYCLFCLGGETNSPEGLETLGTEGTVTGLAEPPEDRGG